MSRINIPVSTVEKSQLSIIDTEREVTLPRVPLTDTREAPYLGNSTEPLPSSEIRALSSDPIIQRALEQLNFSANIADRQLARNIHSNLHGYGTIRFEDEIDDKKNKVSATIRGNNTSGYDVVLSRALVERTASGDLPSLTLGAIMSDEITHIHARRDPISDPLPRGLPGQFSHMLNEESLSKINQALYLTARALGKKVSEITPDDINREGTVDRIARIAGINAPYLSLERNLPPTVAVGSTAAGLLGLLGRYHDRLLGVLPFSKEAVPPQLNIRTQLIDAGIREDTATRLSQLADMNQNIITAANSFKEYYRVRDKNDLLALAKTPEHAVVDALRNDVDYPAALLKERGFSGLKELAGDKVWHSGQFINSSSPRETNADDSRKVAALVRQLMDAEAIPERVSQADVITRLEVAVNRISVPDRRLPFHLVVMQVQDPLAPGSKPFLLPFFVSSDASIPPKFLGMSYGIHGGIPR